MDELTERLLETQPVIVGGRETSLEEFRDRLEKIGTVFIKFTGTRGGTDLGVTVDKEASDLTGGDFELGTGTVHVVGTLRLNYDPVRCVADIDLATLSGTGRLEIRDDSDDEGDDDEGDREVPGEREEVA
jgi:hypothetical protein